MTITPQGQVYLCKTKLENDYKNQLAFSSATEQLNYFNSVIQYTFDNYTYIKKDSVIQVGKNIDEIIDCNYLFYKNIGFTNKWYFCFITNMEYVNENCTRITFETDCYQTWLFQIEYKESFIEREHVNDDTIGLHTVPENLELGEFIINNVEELDSRANNLYICMGLSRYPSNLQLDNENRIYGKVYSGLLYLLFDDATSCSKMIKAMDNLGYADDIFTIFTIPTSLSFSNEWHTGDLGDQTGIKFAIVKTSNSATSMVSNKTITINNTIDGYTPKNKKLLTYPYNYLYITNNGGNDTIYKYEDFTNNNPAFNIDGIITTGCSIKLYPLNYKKSDTSVWKTKCYNYGMVGNKYPTCSWKSDSYTNWLTQNSVNIAINTVSNLSSIGVGAYTGNASAVTSGALGIANTLSQVYEASFMPNQAKGNTNGGDITCSNEMMGFTAYQMSIRNEYAKIIDNYFNMFGYKINLVKVPNITGRNNWNYVKTIDCNFDGDIPQTDLNIIKTMFNNGVTLWHDPNSMYNYSNSNNIL